MKRNTVLAIGLVAVVVAALLGWIAGRGIRSPAEIAARTAPPDASPIVVPVEQKVLASTVVTRGTVRYGSPLNVVLPRSPAKQGNVIMTIAPVRGATLGEGNLAMTVSGRPVFVLQGPQPVYRDMGTGAGGQDVRQLEEALDRMGHGPGPVDGVYDGATGAAVRAWYAAAGWAPFDAGEGPGSVVPADEVVFFPSLPVRVDDVFLQAGQEVGGPVMVVTSSQLTVTTGLSLEDAKLVRVGATVQLEEPDLGITAPGVVAAIADTPGTLGIDPSRYYLEVTPIFPPPALAGKSVVMTIAVDATEDDVLAVPIAALSVGADNTTRVEVQPKRGASRIVVVEPGLAAQGLVEVTPVRGELAAGDLVVVGYGDSGRRTIPAPTSTTRGSLDGQ